MFDFANRAGRAIGIRQAAPSLPFVAHSLTRDEVRDQVRKELIGIVLALGLLVLLFGAIVALIDIGRNMRLLLAGIAAAFVLTCGIRAALRVRRRIRYNDPLLHVEVGDRGIELLGSSGRVGKSYAELAVIEILTHGANGRVRFDGIVIATSAGSLQLGNEWFDGGNAAAGAILQRMDELGVPLQLRGGILS